MSKLWQEAKFWLFSLLAWAMISVIGHTARFRVIGYEKVKELIRSGRGFILAVWHGRTLLPVHYCRGMGIYAIVSLSRDGEFQARILRRFGFVVIRGSSRRGGMKAAISASKKLREGAILAITPDGPNGPPNEVRQGIVFLAQQSGCPIIPIGVGAQPRKLMPTWDSYALPLPFARCALVFGEPIRLTNGGPSGDSPPEEMLKSALDEVQYQAQMMVRECCG